MKGDYYRYMAEYSEGGEKDKYAKLALGAYEEATGLSKDLPTLNPIGLGLALNFSVFYYEVKGEHDKACTIAEEAIKKADVEAANIDEEAEEYKDTISILNLLKENLEMWKNEDQEN